MDYGKYRYEMQKRKKKPKKMQVKEIRLSPFIEDHDIKVKAKMAERFLKNGNKIKVSMRFRGREMDYVDTGKEVMRKFAEICSCKTDKINFDGRNLTMNMKAGV